MEITVPDNIGDFPAAIEQATVHLSDVTQNLENLRRQKRKLKTKFKMEARDSDASNRTERKAYVEDRKENSSLYQTTLEKIDNLSLEQARLKGRLKRLEAELDLHLQANEELPEGVSMPA